MPRLPTRVPAERVLQLVQLLDVTLDGSQAAALPRVPLSLVEHEQPPQRHLLARRGVPVKPRRLLPSVDGPFLFRSTFLAAGQVVELNPGVRIETLEGLVDGIVPLDRGKEPELLGTQLVDDRHRQQLAVSDHQAVLQGEMAADRFQDRQDGAHIGGIPVLPEPGTREAGVSGAAKAQRAPPVSNSPTRSCLQSSSPP
jgi:hypothetical protein